MKSNKKPKKRVVPPGRTPTAAYLSSMWATDYIPTWQVAASEEAITAAEARLGVKFPALLKKQLAIQNGGSIVLDAPVMPFEDKCRFWTNAIVDGVNKIEDWITGAKWQWFDNARTIPGLDLLVVFACHSEAQLCLDYREGGPKRMPAISFVDVCARSVEVVEVAPTADEFITAIIKSKGETA